MTTPIHPKFIEVRKRLSPGSRGIEIAPWTRPIAPKREGFDTVVVDICDRAQLLARAAEGRTPKEQIEGIEDVDVVGDASRLYDLIRGHGVQGTFEWVVSAHNFEHLPNPLGFLQDVEKLLDPKGMLIMVVPDKRFMFDRFKPHSTSAALVQAALQPPAPDRDHWAAFSQRSLGTELRRGAKRPLRNWSATSNEASALSVLHDLRTVYRELQHQLSAQVPNDFSGHRWYYTPAGLRLIVLDLCALGLIHLSVEQLWSNPSSCDFTVVLRRDDAAPDVAADGYDARRSQLCRELEDELARVTNAYLALEARLRELDKRRTALRLRRWAARLARTARVLLRTPAAELRRRARVRRG